MAETPKTRTPLLSLDTLVERQHVAIDGQPYDLVNAGELSIVDYHRVSRKGALVQSLLEAGAARDLTDDQVETLRDLLDALVKVLLLAPPDLVARLNDNQKLAIIQTFTSLQRGKKAPPAGVAAVGEARPSTGESSSHE